MTKFVDLHVIPRVDDAQSCQRMAGLFHVAGYTAVALTVPTGLLRDRVAELRRLFEEEGVSTHLRVDLSANSRMDLLRLLRRFRDMYDVVAVNCVNQAVATVACRDRRVDIVFFDPQNQRTRFGHALARVLRGSLEFNTISTFLGEGRREIFLRVSKEAAIAREHSSKVVLSSGCSSPYMVRSPLQMSAIGASIGLSQTQCIRGVGETPLSIINRNQERRSREYVEEGVKLIVPKTR